MINRYKTQIIFLLLIILGTFYAVNIFLTRNVSNALISTPTELSFMIVEPPKNECQDCFNANNVAKVINATHNIKYTSNNLLYESKFSQKYIKLYGIKNLPAIVVSGDIANKDITSAWKALSGKKVNGRIVIENLLPYYDIKSGRVKGVISAVLLKDKTCKKCFNENEYLKILKRFGMFVGNVADYDIASKQGKALERKYAIVKIPALILSPDAGDYPGFVSSWKGVGTVEKNGWFVFREVQKLNSGYKNI